MSKETPEERERRQERNRYMAIRFRAKRLLKMAHLDEKTREELLLVVKSHRTLQDSLNTVNQAERKFIPTLSRDDSYLNRSCVVVIPEKPSK